ncbi:MAG: uL15 family ribosomal protein [Candidatus Pacearchaeota archaeon]|jgi:large subunit ribosomal protein L18e
MISKTKIKHKTRKKTNSYLVETISLANKNNHLDLARALTISTKRQPKLNLNDLNNVTEKEIIFPGKILSMGNINKKIKISAINFSDNAKEKLKKAGCETKRINDEIRDNPTLKGVQIIYGKNNN